MRRILLVLLIWLCSACVLTTVHGRSLPWLKDSTQKRQTQIDIGGKMCQVDIRNCDYTGIRGWQRANEESRNRQRDRTRIMNKRRLVDILQGKDQDIEDDLNQNRRR